MKTSRTLSVLAPYSPVICSTISNCQTFFQTIFLSPYLRLLNSLCHAPFDSLSVIQGAENASSKKTGIIIGLTLFFFFLFWFVFIVSETFSFTAYYPISKKLLSYIFLSSLPVGWKLLVVLKSLLTLISILTDILLLLNFSSWLLIFFCILVYLIFS